MEEGSSDARIAESSPLYQRGNDIQKCDPEDGDRWKGSAGDGEAVDNLGATVMAHENDAEGLRGRWSDSGRSATGMGDKGGDYGATNGEFGRSGAGRQGLGIAVSWDLPADDQRDTGTALGNEHRL